MHCLLPPPTVIPGGISPPPPPCPLLQHNISASPRPFLVSTQIDPPRSLKKKGGGNIPQTILTGDRINKLCFTVDPPPLECPLLSYTVELLLRPCGRVFCPLFWGGGGLGGAGSPGANSPPPLERIRFPPLVNCCVNIY